METLLNESAHKELNKEFFQNIARRFWWGSFLACCVSRELYIHECCYSYNSFVWTISLALVCSVSAVAPLNGLENLLWNGMRLFHFSSFMCCIIIIFSATITGDLIPLGLVSLLLKPSHAIICVRLRVGSKVESRIQLKHQKMWRSLLELLPWLWSLKALKCPKVISIIVLYFSASHR